MDTRTTHAQDFKDVKSSLLVRLCLSRGWDQGTKREGCESENTAVGYPRAVLVTTMASYSHFFFFFAFIGVCFSSGLHKGWELVGLTGLEEIMTRLRLVGHFLPIYIHSLVTSSPEARPLCSGKTVS